MYELALPLVVALVTVAGTLAGVWLTQGNANRREDVRWERESERVASETELRRMDEHRTWLKNQRLAAYSGLLSAANAFWTSLIPLNDVLERQDDPKSELNGRRSILFSAIGACRLLADAQLQGALHALSDAAENVGHRPYADDPSRESAWRHELFDEVGEATRRVEDLLRAELELPERVPHDARYWLSLGKSSGE